MFYPKKAERCVVGSENLLFKCGLLRSSILVSIGYFSVSMVYIESRHRINVIFCDSASTSWEGVGAWWERGYGGDGVNRMCTCDIWAYLLARQVCAHRYGGGLFVELMIVLLVTFAHFRYLCQVIYTWQIASFVKSNLS